MAKRIILFLLLSFLYYYTSIKYPVFFPLITVTTLLSFFILFTKWDMGIIATVILFVALILPYNYHLVKVYSDHYGGAWPHPVFSPLHFALIISFLISFLFKFNKLNNYLYVKLGMNFFVFLFFSIYAIATSIVASTYPVASFYEFLRMLIGLLLYLQVSFFIRSQKELSLITWIIGIFILVEGIIAVLQFYKILPLDLIKGESVKPLIPGFITQIFRRSTGTLKEANAFGKFLSIFTPPFVIYSMISKGWRRIFSTLIFVSAATAIFLTLSRSSVVGFILSLIIVFIILFHRKPPGLISLKNFLFITLSVFVSFVTVFLITANILYLRFIRFGLLTLQGRLAQYINALYIIKNHILLGIGLNNYYPVMITNDYTGIAAATPQYVVHNIFLLYCAETGILGLILFLLFFWYSFKGNYQDLKKLNKILPSNLSEENIALIYGGLASIISIFLQGTFDWGFRTDNMFHFLFFLGLLNANRNILFNQEADNKQF
ncbi:hypothetical protein DRQ23_06530 [bacterium]|mgnify:CR=1 FL=1|nr:MAG: hypothetical protein DRQ23_06530 [bacterium]